MAPTFLACGCKRFDDGGIIFCGQHAFEYNERKNAVGKVLEFKRPQQPEPPTVLEADQAIKQVSKLFTKEELAIIQEDLKKINDDEATPK